MRIGKSVLILCVLFLTSSQIFAQCKDEGCGLVIRGKVTDIETDRSDKTFVRFKIKLDVEFVNEGAQPIILFKPDHDFGYWLGGWSLFHVNDPKNENLIFSDGYWQSVSGGSEYRKLAEKLDAKTPPDDVTKILQPKESWKFSSDFQIAFQAEKNYSYPPRKTWKEMQEFSPMTFQMTIAYELSPWNIEYFKPNLIRKLQKRWKSYGNVLVEKEKDGRYNHFVYVSEPMLIDFSQAREKMEGTN